ncbi:PQQ-dependent sugar dehydrogenase [Serratia ureilytica]
MRLTAEGAVPPDNPGRPPANGRRFVAGHRNCGGWR